MGGLASFYLMCEYPDVFGAAACLSTHWIGSLDLNTDYSMNDDPVCAAALLQYFSEHLPSPADHRIYLDQGTAGWDALYIRYESQAREMARDNGYSESDGSMMTYDARGAGHNEWYWQQRASRPITFLLSADALASVVSPGVPDASAEETIVCDIMGRPVSGLTPADPAPGIYVTDRRRLIRVGTH